MVKARFKKRAYAGVERTSGAKTFDETIGYAEPMAGCRALGLPQQALGSATRTRPAAMAGRGLSLKDLLGRPVGLRLERIAGGTDAALGLDAPAKGAVADRALEREQIAGWSRG